MSYCCAACLSAVVVVVVDVAVVFLFVYVCLRVLMCSVIVGACGARSRVRDASHRRQHCGASIEDRGCCGVKLHLAACRSWVGRWDDGGLGAAYYCCAAGCCLSLSLLLLLFCFFLSMFACVCWCARSSQRHGARSRVRYAAHRRQHCFAIIKGLACSGFNLHLAAFYSWVGRWNDVGESCAVLCYCCRWCCLCMLPPRSPKTLFYC